MKKEKLNLGSIKNVLSRAELKKIMAGSGGQCYLCECWTGSKLNGSSVEYETPVNDCNNFCVNMGYGSGESLGELSC
jgi:hypothetical protein